MTYRCHYAVFQMPVFKVWNRDRSDKESCVASSLEELKLKGTTYYESVRSDVAKGAGAGGGTPRAALAEGRHFGEK